MTFKSLVRITGILMFLCFNYGLWADNCSCKCKCSFECNCGCTQGKKCDCPQRDSKGCAFNSGCKCGCEQGKTCTCKDPTKTGCPVNKQCQCGCEQGKPCTCHQETKPVQVQVSAVLQHEITQQHCQPEQQQYANNYQDNYQDNYEYNPENEGNGCCKKIYSYDEYKFDLHANAPPFDRYGWLAPCWGTFENNYTGEDGDYTWRHKNYRYRTGGPECCEGITENPPSTCDDVRYPESVYWYPHCDYYPVDTYLCCDDDFMDCCESAFIWIPEAPPLFRPFIADPREVCYSVAWRFDDKLFDKNLAPVSFGDSLPLFRWYRPWNYDGVFQLDLEGCVYAIFEQTELSAPLVNADYYVGFPMSYATGPWSFRLRPYHISSHIGDEFLLEHLGFDRRNASSEFIDFAVSWQPRRWIRLYGLLGWIVMNDHEFPRKSFYSEYGLEYLFERWGYYVPCSRLLIEPLFAAHFRTYADFNYKFDGTFALGIQFAKLCGLERRVRLQAEYHDGNSAEGQFAHFRTNYWQIKLTYGY